MQTSPPGPTGEPVFGSGRRYSADPLRFLSDIERSYSGIAAVDIGPVRTHIVTDPSAIEAVLVGDAGSYRKPGFQRDAIGDLLGDGLLLSEGETWERQRKLANPAFTMGRLASFDERIAGHAEGLIDRWTAGETRDIEAEMTRVTVEVIADLMLGTSLGERQLTRLRENLEPIGRQFEPDPLRFALPSWLPLPGDRAYDSAVDAVDEIVDDIIAQRRGTQGGSDGPMDLLSVLLRAQEDGEVSRSQLRDEVVTTLLAGHDTTALALTFTWYLLSKHPEKREKLHREVDGIDGTPTMADIQELDYTAAVLKESMRLYPPVYSLFREPERDVELLGYGIEAGSPLMLPQWAVHRSPTYWSDPDQFRPERWQSEQAGDRPRFAYFPFGGGPRHCIGKNLAELEAKTILAVIARRYELSYEGRDPPKLAPSLTLHPREGMEMTIDERGN